MTAAVLLVVSLLFVSVPGTAVAAENARAVAAARNRMPPKCRNGEIIPRVTTISGCVEKCMIGSLLGTCVETTTYKICVRGVWQNRSKRRKVTTKVESEKCRVCKNGEKAPKVVTVSNCETKCIRGYAVRTCIETTTWKICARGVWRNQSTRRKVTERMGRCECSHSGGCGKCKHCDNNFKCVPDPCKASPSSPNDCPCVNK
jgi:hypothetical protein